MSGEEQKKTSDPLVNANQQLPEITFKAVILSCFLIILLAASNAYLGLKVGTTISASIPAVVIAMGLFRLFRKHSVLEINIVQTAASVGEGITAGLAFTIPALIILHYWTHFHYWEMAFLGLFGGILGVLFSIPLRRALLDEKTLKFPEGVAIGQVMKVSAGGGGSVKPIIHGGLAGVIIAFSQTGLRVVAQSYDFWIVKGKMLLGYGLGFSPAVLAAGYICGVNVGISVLIGIILGWIIGIPAISYYFGFSNHVGSVAAAHQIWNDYIRYIGVGTMLIGGLWTLATLFKPVIKAVKASFEALQHIKRGHAHKILRTEKDIPINYVLWGGVLIAIAIFIQLWQMTTPEVFGISLGYYIVVLLVCVAFLFFAGFILSSVSGYFAGLVGATNSPGSGLLVAGILVLSFILLLMLGHAFGGSAHSFNANAAAGLAVIICAFIGAALVMTNESIQVAKAGEMIGCTPWKQQVVLITGVLVVAFTLPLILSLLFNAYGIGGVFPHKGMDASQMLSAPQAGLIAAVAQGVFSHQLPWAMMIIGAVIAVIGIIFDEGLKHRFGLRLPVLAVGLGIYLPLSASIPIFVGGIVSYLVQKKVHARHGVVIEDGDVHISKGMHNALFLACGLVAGCTITGVILAIPFAITQNSDVLRIMPENLRSISVILAILMTLGLCYWIYKSGVKQHPIDKA